MYPQLADLPTYKILTQKSRSGAPTPERDPAERAPTRQANAITKTVKIQALALSLYHTSVALRKGLWRCFSL